MVYDDMEYIHEADIFANQAKFVKPLLPYEIFMANIKAGNDNQLKIKSIVESYGLIVSSSKILGGICAIATLELIYRKYGYHVLNRSLRLCVGTWESDNNSLSANILKGTAYLIVTFGEDLREDIFKDKVGIFSVRQIARTAKERQGGSLGYAETMLMEYNKKMKYPLKLSKLYESKKTLIKYGIKTEFEDEI
jgi:hypothetical protein